MSRSARSSFQLNDGASVDRGPSTKLDLCRSIYAKIDHMPG